MALNLTYQLGGDLAISAYARISNCTIEYNPTLAGAITAGLKFIAKPTLEIKSGKNKNRQDTWRQESWVFAYDHTSNQNLIHQAYTYLKTTPEIIATAATDATE